MNKLRTTALGITALSLTAAALAATTYTVQLNGKTIPGGAIVQGGKTYVSSDALKAAGISVSVKGNVVSLTTTAGGANQIGALSGCMNEQLFNGIWRFKVLNVTETESQWKADIEVRNATQRTISLIGTGLPFDKNFNLQLDSGNVLAARSGAVGIRDRGFIQGSSFATTLEFDKNDQGGKPMKMVVIFNPNDTYFKTLGLKYPVPDPSFRVDLTCKK